MSIRNRIYLAFASVILFVGLFSWSVVQVVAQMHDNTEKIGDELFEKIQITYEFVIEQNKMNTALSRMRLGIAPASSSEEYQRSQAAVRLLDDKLSSLIETEEEKLLYDEVMRRLQWYSETAHRYIELIESGQTPMIGTVMPVEVDAIHDLVVQSMSDFLVLQEQLVEAKVAETTRQQRLAEIIVYGGVSFLLLLCVITGLGVARSALRSIQYVTDVMNRVEERDALMLPRMSVPSNDEMAGIAASYNKMADILENHARREADYNHALEDQNWIESNFAAAIQRCQGKQTIEDFAKEILSHTVQASEASAGALYYADADQDGNLFICAASYAMDPAVETRKSFVRGAGLVGQCAAEGKVIEQTAPLDYMRIASGLGDSAAVHLLLLPVFFEGKVTAVIEIASFHPFKMRERKFLEELTSNRLGLLLHDIASNMRVQALLVESQTYVEELQAQSEELQQQQEELRSLNEKLADQYREAEQRRSELELIRAELEAKADELQASSQFKSEFLANISHELRTPLNSLLILAQMLEKDPDQNLTEKQKEYAQTILYSGNELLMLINDVLDLSKIEAGQMELTDDVFSPGEFASDLKRQFEGVAAQKGLDFRISINAELANSEFITDRHRLLQITNNLLSNAFKFTEVGSVALRIFEEAQPKDDGAPPGMTLLSFQVSDTGIGIPANKHALIFEAFRQADGKTNRRFGGTGLGLAISKELAGMMGGTISLVSEEGLGSTFTATIPVRRWDYPGIEGLARIETAVSQEPPAELPQDDPAEFPQQHSASSRGKILLVDDDIRNVYALSAALVEQHYEVVFAEDGETALRKLRESPDVDLVIMDMMMPGIDGYEAMRSIRAIPMFEKLPIIAVTAKAMKQDRELCIEAGASDYLSKPVKLEKLISLLRVWLHGKGCEET